MCPFVICIQQSRFVLLDPQINVLTIHLLESTVNFGRSNSPVSNTRDRSNSFVGPGNFPVHLMLKYTPGSNSDGSNSVKIIVFISIEGYLPVFQVLNTCKNAFYHDDSGKVVFIAFVM